MCKMKHKHLDNFINTEVLLKSGSGLTPHDSKHSSMLCKACVFLKNALNCWVGPKVFPIFLTPKVILQVQAMKGALHYLLSHIWWLQCIVVWKTILILDFNLALLSSWYQLKFESANFHSEEQIKIGFHNPKSTACNGWHILYVPLYLYRLVIQLVNMHVIPYCHCCVHVDRITDRV